MKNRTIFISAIDTNAGKTVFTGLLAKYLQSHGINVITQKLVQTGCEGISEDIAEHRRIMDVPLNEYDKDGTTCPYVFKYPASPHLAAEIENRVIDSKVIISATKKLEENFDLVLLEGAGGLQVPIKPEQTIIDYIAEKNYPMILVANAKLGSINHTLLSLEAIKKRNINLLGLAFNHYNPGSEIILNDTRKLIEDQLKRHFAKTKFIEYNQDNLNKTKELLSIF